jgi:hypothetical protein
MDFLRNNPELAIFLTLARHGGKMKHETFLKAVEVE